VIYEPKRGGEEGGREEIRAGYGISKKKEPGQMISGVRITVHTSFSLRRKKNNYLHLTSP